MRNLMLLLATTVVACGTPASSDNPPRGDARRGGDQGDLALTITSSPVKAGGEVDFTFTNGEPSTVTTGELSCVNRYEQEMDDGTWQTLESMRLCILIAMIHQPGQQSKHTTAAPDSPGTYRLVVDAWSDAGQQLTARSTTFEVVPR